MYSNLDYFATADTKVTVDLDGDEVFIRVKDEGFSANIIFDRSELSVLLGKYDRYSFHNAIRFDSFTFYDKPDGMVDELKFTLEMI